MLAVFAGATEHDAGLSERRAVVGGTQAVWCRLVDAQHQHPQEVHRKGMHRKLASSYPRSPNLCWEAMVD